MWCHNSTTVKCAHKYYKIFFLLFMKMFLCSTFILKFDRAMLVGANYWSWINTTLMLICERQSEQLMYKVWASWFLDNNVQRFWLWFVQRGRHTKLWLIRFFNKLIIQICSKLVGSKLTKSIVVWWNFPNKYILIKYLWIYAKISQIFLLTLSWILCLCGKVWF